MPDLESTAKWKVDISELKASMADAKRAISLAGAEFRTATAGMDKWSKSADGVAAKLDQLNKILPQQENILKDLEKQYEITAREMGADSSEAQRLAIQVENQRAAVERTKSDINKYTAQLEDMRKESSTAAQVSAKLKDGLAAAGKAAAEAAAVGFAVFTAAVTAAVGALAKATVEAASYADEMLTMSTVTGVATDDLQAYSYAAELVDVSLETMTGAMTKNVKSMASAAKGTGATAEAYKALGISVTDANGELRDSEEVFWEAIDALGAIENETQRDALAMQIFGKSARDLNPLIEEGSAAMAAYTEEARAMGAVMSSEQLEALGEFDDTMQRMKQGAEAGKRALGLLLLPVLKELGGTGTEMLGRFTNGIIAAAGDWTKISEVVGETVGGFAEMIMGEMPKIIELGTTIMKSLAGAIIGALPLLAAALADTLPEMLGGFGEMLPMLAEVGIEVIINLIDGISEALPELMAMLPEIIVAIVSALMEHLPDLLNAGMRLLEAVMAGIMAVTINLFQKMSEVGAGVVSSFKTAVAPIWEAGRDLVRGIWNGISGAYNWLKDMIRSWVGNVVDFIKNLFGIHSPSTVMAEQVGRWLPEGMAAGFEKDMPVALDSMKRSLNGAVDELKDDLTLGLNGLTVPVSASGGVSGSGGGQVVNFNQTINSPKAVDRLTLYRETNSLLFSAKVRLNNV